MVTSGWRMNTVKEGKKMSNGKEGEMKPRRDLGNEEHVMHQ
jgi:hypothetical protein